MTTNDMNICVTIKSVIERLYWLETHNKNYTKEQYFTIQSIKDDLEKLIIDKEA